MRKNIGEPAKCPAHFDLRRRHGSYVIVKHQTLVVDF